MKKKGIVFAVVLAAITMIAAGAWANTVKVTGDLQKDGKLMIDIDWKVDTSKYPKLSRDVVQSKVREEIREQVLPKIVDATKGAPIALGKSHFTVIKETQDLLKSNPDGTKVIALKMTVEYTAVANPAIDLPEAGPVPAPAPTASEKEKKVYLTQRWDYDT